ncbi:MAG: symporter small accessory protein [Thermodesulfobacteriota bacterium]
MMFGLGSLGAALAFWLSIGAALLCVGYGLRNWNRDQPDRK